MHRIRLRGRLCRFVYDRGRSARTAGLGCEKAVIVGQRACDVCGKRVWTAALLSMPLRDVRYNGKMYKFILFI